jgi:hypothetical protein
MDAVIKFLKFVNHISLFSICFLCQNYITRRVFRRISIFYIFLNTSAVIVMLMVQEPYLPTGNFLSLTQQNKTKMSFNSSALQVFCLTQEHSRLCADKTNQKAVARTERESE